MERPVISNGASAGRHPATALSFYQAQSQYSDAPSETKYHGKKRQARLGTKGVQWSFAVVLLVIYLYQCRRLFLLYRTSNSSASDVDVGYFGPRSVSRNSILPRRIIAVFGTESSGSTFLATTLGIASGSFPENGTYVTLPSDRNNSPGRTIEMKVVTKSSRSPNGEIEIQHLSLPWGYWGTPKRNCLLSSNTTTVDALVPEPCFRYAYQAEWQHRLAATAPAGCREEAHISGKGDATWTCGTNDCGAGQNEGYALYPRRFFVNVSSHLDWYLQRGVDITAVLSVRDQSISRAGKERMHCPDATIGMLEEEKARSLMADALRRYGRKGRVRGSGASSDSLNEERAIAVSYETLMALKETYLFDIYNILGIDSTFVPKFKDGNEKYVSTK